MSISLDDDDGSGEDYAGEVDVSFRRILAGAFLFGLALMLLAWAMSATSPRADGMQDAGAARRVPKAKPWAHLTGSGGAA